MVPFGCLICKEGFLPNGQAEGVEDTKRIPVLTICGHYFHLSCIEGAFVYEKVSSNSNRKSCPYSECKRDLNNSTLVKIRPVELAEDVPDHNKKVIRELQGELVCIRNFKDGTGTYEVGDSVVVDCSSHNAPGIVTKVLVEVQLVGNGPCINNEYAKTISKDFNWREILTNKFILAINGTLGNNNSSGQQHKKVLVPKHKVKLVGNKSLAKSNELTTKVAQMPADAYAKLRPKWQAGDRIYITKERQFATIKWIGSRQYKFGVVIEYDNPIGDVDFDCNDLPFTVRRGFGKRMGIGELNDKARKISHNTGLQLLTKIHQWSNEKLISNT